VLNHHDVSDESRRDEEVMHSRFAVIYVEPQLAPCPCQPHESNVEDSHA
jgi:hypothetical protein